MTKKIILSLLSALLLSLPWLTGLSFTLLFAFVPLLVLQDMRPRRLGWWAALTFGVWIVATTWWVSKATIIALFAIPLVGLFFCLTPFLIYHYVWLRGPRALAWTVFVTGWIAFEALYMYNDISFPWLTLGYGFASSHWMVQWYSLTGSFGGSFWILVSNILCFYAWQNFRASRLRALLPALGWIAVPIAVSYIMYFNFELEPDPVNVAVVQPNIDPYGEKFDSMDQDEQFDIIMELIRQVPPYVDYIVTPETSLDDNFWIGTLEENPHILTLRDTMRTLFPKASLVLGATTYRSFAEDEPGGPATRQYRDIRYEIYNSALYIDNAPRTGIYHKSRLVVGAETTPYPKIFRLLEFLSPDLGGVSGNFGVHDQRYVFGNPSGMVSGTAICFESVYGEYFTDYIRNGAQIMFIITNDGWWGNTPGHKHHLNYARLRAIETRRSIARSANTGISALIDPRGDVIESLGWDKRGVISGTLDRNSQLTRYVRWGDVTARVCILVLGLSLLYYVAWTYRHREPGSSKK